MSTNNKRVYFKKVWTIETTHLDVNPEWTIDNFTNIMKNIIPHHFAGTTHFELVAMGNGENAPAIVLNDSKLSSIYGPELNVGFYIRPIITLAATAEIVLTCVLCENNFTNIELINNNNTSVGHFGCSHRFCNNCHQNYVDSSNNTYRSICPYRCSRLSFEDR
jgi:hypothetical protein